MVKIQQIGVQQSIGCVLLCEQPLVLRLSSTAACLRCCSLQQCLTGRLFTATVCRIYLSYNHYIQRMRLLTAYFVLVNPWSIKVRRRIKPRGARQTALQPVERWRVAAAAAQHTRLAWLCRQHIAPERHCKTNVTHVMVFSILFGCGRK